MSTSGNAVNITGGGERSLVLLTLLRNIMAIYLTAAEGGSAALTDVPFG